MKAKVIKFKNGSSIETLPNTHTAARSDVKYVLPRVNGKPVLSMDDYEWNGAPTMTNDERSNQK